MSTIFLASSGGGDLAGEAKHVGVVVLARQRGGFVIANQRRADAGNLVRRDAHADARGADQQAELRLVRRHALRHRLGVIGIIRGFLRRACQNPSTLTPAFLQMLLQRLLQFEAAVVRAQGDRRRASAATAWPRRWSRLVR